MTKVTKPKAGVKNIRNRQHTNIDKQFIDALVILMEVNKIKYFLPINRNEYEKSVLFNKWLDSHERFIGIDFDHYCEINNQGNCN